MALLLAALLIRSMLVFDQLSFRWHKHDLFAESCNFEVLVAWYEYTPQTRYDVPGWLIVTLERRPMGEARGAWARVGPRFDADDYFAGNYTARSAQFPHWFGIVALLSLPAMQLAVRQFRRRGKLPPAFPVSTA
ncbi:MAG TPA: hypothetical protein VH370_12755 [Humisphaera sp.]|jgi:hypothetical protein|nr:hypothetical protein [Humisphaera sp.]